ncbi:T6SS phospholipase effector Tle1-like catalytic domain-containing protein [Variovorax sp. JS1663]|uniref:T6SS phospholipase effector Tle1-like catalytic domain-containing protein n=1 Tax=Variovorax sp. JS1663 TaxID=1851577 RepID=UPI000B34A172
MEAEAGPKPDSVFRRDREHSRVQRRNQRHQADEAPQQGGAFRQGVQQIVYYDPGVGTNNEFPPAGFLAGVTAKWKLISGLALGQGAFENVEQGYDFLCREYMPGDRIWLFDSPAALSQPGP